MNDLLGEGIKNEQTAESKEVEEKTTKNESGKKKTKSKKASNTKGLINKDFRAYLTKEEIESLGIASKNLDMSEEQYAAKAIAEKLRRRNSGPRYL